MKAADLRPGDWVTWNGHRASVTHTVGQRGQRHAWVVGVVFDGAGDALPLNLHVPPDMELDVG